MTPSLQENIVERALRACRRAFAAVAVFSMGVNLLMLTLPIFMLQVFDRVLPSQNTDTLTFLLIMGVFAILVLAALDAIRGAVLARVSLWLDGVLAPTALRTSVLQQLDEPGGGSAQTLRDLSAVRGFLAGPGMFPLMDAPWTPVFLLVLFLLHPLLGVMALAGAVVLAVLAIANEVTTRAPLKKASGAQVQALNQAEAAVRNADVLEAMGMMDNLLRRWSPVNAAHASAQDMASTRGIWITSFSKFIRLGLQLGIIAAGAWLAVKGDLTPGAMIAGSILMGRALAPIEQAIGTWKALVAARIAHGRLKAGMARAEAQGPRLPLPAPEGNVAVETVTFRYEGAEAPTLRAVDVKIRAGESVAVIGPTASGKTTFARLLIGNLRPTIGHVRLDNMDIFEWDKADLGRHLGYLPQTIELFDGTVADNIARLAEPDADAVVAAAKAAGVHEMILRLPQGYDTEIGLGGKALSGGQRQRVALARALYGAPKLVILDEPNANLDGEGELALGEAIKRLTAQGVTVVVIAHRASLVKHVETVIVLQDGRLTAHGPRDDVLARIGLSGDAQKDGTLNTENAQGLRLAQGPGRGKD